MSGRRTLLALVSLLLTAGPLLAAEVTVVNMDPPGQGLNDPTPASPVGGNPGTTLGQQRLNVFKAAANYWGARLHSNVPIRLEASMVELFCDPNRALLGQAGPVEAFRDFPGAPKASTWYPVALASALAGQDLDPDHNDIVAFFNSNLDSDANCLGGAGWFYGIDAPAPSGQLAFFTTVLHELGHGLGFSSFADPSTGEELQGFDDIFGTLLRDESTGKAWNEMSNGERTRAATRTGNLTWSGSGASAAGSVLTKGVHPSGRLRMYAPNPLQLGSSVAHWDTEVTANELMEPFITGDAEDLVTTDLFGDLGWGLLERSTTCVADADTLCLGANDRFKVEVSWLDFEGNTGSGLGNELSNTSGLLYFFNPNNLEMLIKVLDGCPVNGRFWVFFAATTNVGFRVEVTDTETGRRRTYVNPIGKPANAITDTSAFATCEAGEDLRWTGTDSALFEGERLAQRELLAELERRQLSATELRDERGVVRNVFPMSIESPFVADRVGAEFISDREMEPTARLLVLKDRPLGTAGPKVGPEGSTYSVRPLLGHPSDGGFTVFNIQQPGSSTVTFDGINESLPRYSIGSNTLPRVKESASLRSDGKTLDVSVTMLSKDGDDLFPSGVIGNGQPLTAGGIGIGIFGEDPLDFPHEKVTSFKMLLKGDNQTLATFTAPASAFPGGSWNGSIGAVVGNIAGRGVDAIELKAAFDLGSSGGGGNDDPGIDGDPVDPFTCVPSSTVLCLNDSRFQVKVEWGDFLGNVGSGSTETISGSSDSGLFWFFSPDNLEMLIKVLDGCGVNDNYWVFFAATTNVEFTVTVADSQSGEVRIYDNQLGSPADAVTDIGAFSTCP